jgi:hypothetical protein
MKILVEVWLNGTAEDLLKRVLDLPDELRPVRFSSGEKVRSKDDVVDDENRFSKFVERNPAGFALFCDGLTYDVMLRVSPKTLSCYLTKDASRAHTLLQHFLGKEFLFGFACDYEEWLFRNRLVKDVGSQRVESWVGRDTSKYIPGLYWLTAISKTLVAQHAADASQIKAVAKVLPSPSAHVLFFQRYDRPDGWMAHKAAISLNGFFRIDDAIAAVKSCNTYLEVNGALAAWR